MSKFNKAINMLEQILERAEPDQQDFLIAGQSCFLNNNDTRRLLKLIAEQPEDTRSRWCLVNVPGIHKPKSDEQLATLVNNLLWLIKNRPESKGHQAVLLGHPNPLFDDVKRAWQIELRRRKGSISVAVNAGHTLTLIDKEFAEKCYKRAIKLAPNDADLWQRLSHLYTLQSHTDDRAIERHYAKKSVEALLTAFRYQGNRKDGYVGQYRNMLLREGASLSLKCDMLKQANTLAGLLVDSTNCEAPKTDIPQAIRQHDANDISNAILATIAVKEKQIEKAEHYLDQIRGAVRSEELILCLANSLIRKRRFEAVNRYIQSCIDAMQSVPGSDQDKSAQLMEWLTSLSAKKSVKLKPW